MVRSAAAASSPQFADPASAPPAAPRLWSNAGDATVAKALLIDPDPEVCSASALHMLRQNGISIDQAATPDAALEALRRRSYNLVILELAASDFDGSDLCRRVVERHGPPVLVWSARAAPLDQVAGLELGAEDYLAKTAHPLELLARARTILRRGLATRPQAANSGPQLAPGSWIFDDRVNSLRSWRGGRVWLRPASSGLLAVLCARPREPISRDDLLPAVSRGAEEVAARTVDVVVSRLRRSLEACDGGGYLIRTIRPTGYLFDAVVEPMDGGLMIRG